MWRDERRIPSKPTIDRRQPFDGAVGEDGTDVRIEPAYQALRLAECISEKHARLAHVLIALPPGVDAPKDILRLRPSVDGQAEGAFRDERVARDELEAPTGDVRIRLIVARDDPHLAFLLETNLCGAEDVPGGMQTDTNAVHVDVLAVGDGLDGDIPQTGLQDAHAVFRTEVVARTAASVVRMGVRDDGAVDRTAWVDVETACLAKEAAARRLEERSHFGDQILG